MFKPKGHEKYTSSDYMKLEVGQNKIRILAEPINGYLWWEDAKGNVVPRGQLGGEGAKPVRAKAERQFTYEEIPAMKMFAAMPVWNYQLGKVQILEVTQSKILSALDALVDSKSWGKITAYPIVITKEKTGPEAMNVEYSVMPEPKEPLTIEIANAYKSRPINLEALYEGKDPFNSTDEEKVVEDLDEEADE
jgi:hypothetical protein